MIMTMQHKLLFFPVKSCPLLLLLFLHSSLLINPIAADLFMHNCSAGQFVANSPYQSNLATLLSYLSSNASASAGFYNATVGITYTVYGLFMCRGDVSRELCGDCVSKATQELASDCQLAKEGIIWHDNCFVRYSNRSIFSHMDEQPQICVCNWNWVTDQVESFDWTLAVTLNQVAADAANGGPAGNKFATREAHVSSYGGRTLYSMAQCRPDLTVKDCRKCLNDTIGVLYGRCGGMMGGRLEGPSCKIRFEFNQFYFSPTFKGKRKLRSQIIVVIVVTAIVSMMLLVLGGYFLRKRARKRVEDVLRENLPKDATITLGSLQFSLATIEAATNNFSIDNQIGKSVFGEVYKGILPNGQEIAVKRLLDHSSQGFNEFKNEILLIAKLQHRNLVALLGFYLDKQEKMLIYEYVPNKSLEYFISDPHNERQLSWSERYQIIGGIAGAILYLHDHSRFKVIHCDLNPSNILLDNNMNPKISNFGVAKTIPADKIYGRTNKVVGTRGYMSPEYAKFGKFSEKSDIFSFGVILLEIITGKKNTSNELRNENGLLNYVWKEWSEQTPLQILDSNIKDDSYCETQVNKFIQIGLLCVQEDSNARPSMSTIVSYINSFSIELPSPQEPAFFIHAKKEPMAIDDEKSRSVVQAAGNYSTPCSTNNVTMSGFFPR